VALGRRVGASADLLLNPGRQRLGLDVEDPGGSDDVPTKEQPDRAHDVSAVTRPSRPAAKESSLAAESQSRMVVVVGRAEGTSSDLARRQLFADAVAHSRFTSRSIVR